MENNQEVARTETESPSRSSSMGIVISTDDGTIPVTIGDKTQHISPLDELDEIDNKATAANATEGISFLRVVQSHVSEKFDMPVSLSAADAYYSAMEDRCAQVRDFFTKKLGLHSTSDSIPEPSLLDADAPT